MDNGDIVMTTGQTTHPLGHGWDFYDKMPAGGPDFVSGFDIPTPSPHRFNIVNDITNQTAIVGSSNDGTSPPDLEESNRVMEQHFDFESAANSPGSLERKPTRTSPTSAGFDCHSANGTSGVAIESPARRSRPLSESLSGDAMRHVSSSIPSSLPSALNSRRSTDTATGLPVLPPLSHLLRCHDRMRRLMSIAQ
jgi:hypothetical protein